MAEAFLGLAPGARISPVHLQAATSSAAPSRYLPSSHGHLPMPAAVFAKQRDVPLELGVPAAMFAAAAASLLLRSRPRRMRRTLRRARVVSMAAGVSTDASLDVAVVRQQFPILQEEAQKGKPLVYLDSAATSQKPMCVLEELSRFYQEDNSNVHRGMHALSMRATEAFEGARAKVARFIGAESPDEVIWTRNATEALNLVARTWARATLQPGDDIICTVMEHHSNLVPWQLVAQETGANLRFIGITSEGTLDMTEFEKVLSPRTKLVAVSHVSNVLGCVNPVERIVERAHEVGAKVLVDACQSVPHMPVRVQELGADWLVASGHKMCGPSGIGFLWGRAELLRQSPPFLAGGEMIDQVSLERSTFADIPFRFEAGTPAFAEAVALGAACDFLEDLGMDAVLAHEQKLAAHMWRQVSKIPGARLYGPPPSAGHRAALLSFNVDGFHPHDIATLADQESGVAMRAGHQCCQPLHKELGVNASLRMSAYVYNTPEDVDKAVEAIRTAVEILRGVQESSAAA
eukprot:TRINITY_DN31560_c0_g1_i1.p1 TRINITY_DN31560_c0_g1~~TRINITY_DN31560_c0_g1_i1.p1  ORF type:complete len:519 (-),score=86.63 TRINITY_DN31560_c0_g1_i1:119-1675(-)